MLGSNGRMGGEDHAPDGEDASYSPRTPLMAAALSDPFEDELVVQDTYIEPAPASPTRVSIGVLLLRVLHLCAGSIVGTLMRAAVVNFFSCFHRGRGAGDTCETLDEGALFVTLAPNVLGCLLMGLLAAPALAGLPAEPGIALAALAPRCRQHALTRLHLGLRTGMCGSLTTWASWSQEMVVRSSAGDYSRALLGYTIGTACSAASFGCGLHAAAALWYRHRRGAPAADAPEDDAACEAGSAQLVASPPLPPDSFYDAHPTADDGAALCTLVICAFLCGTVLLVRPPEWLGSACLGALISPLGVLLRWRLSFLNGTLRSASWLPLGTLLANTLGCLFDSVVDAATGRVGRSRLGGALQAGFGGGLSTVSSVAVEIAGLMAVPGKRGRAYTYFFLTLLLGFAPSIAAYNLLKIR